MIGRQVFDCFEDAGRFPEGMGNGRRVLFVGELSAHICELASKASHQWLDVPDGEVGRQHVPAWREAQGLSHVSKPSPASTGEQARG